MTCSQIIAAIVLATLIAWAWGVAQSAYRLARKNENRINKLEKRLDEEGIINSFCSACTREIEDDEKVDIQIDLPMNPESTVLLPVTIELCKECASIGSQA